MYKIKSLMPLPLLTILFCAHINPVLSDSERVAIESKIIAVNERVIHAASIGDVEAMFRVISDNDRGVIIRNGKLIRTRNEAYNLYKELYEGVEKAEYVFKEEYVNVLSGGTAAYVVCSGETIITTRDQRVIRVPFAQTSIFEKQGSEWKVVHAHASVPNR